MKHRAIRSILNNVFIISSLALYCWFTIILENPTIGFRCVWRLTFISLLISISVVENMLLWKLSCKAIQSAIKGFRWFCWIFEFLVDVDTCFNFRKKKSFRVWKARKLAKFLYIKTTHDIIPKKLFSVLKWSIWRRDEAFPVLYYFHLPCGWYVLNSIPSELSRFVWNIFSIISLVSTNRVRTCEILIDVEIMKHLLVEGLTLPQMFYALRWSGIQKKSFKVTNGVWVNWKLSSSSM